MKEEAKNLKRIELLKTKLLKKIILPKIPILLQNDITFNSSKRLLPINIINTSRKLKKKVNLKQYRISENSKDNHLMLNKLMKIKNINLIKSQKSFAQMAKEVAEKNMTHYLSGYYDIFGDEKFMQDESESDNYNDNNESGENSSNEKNNENALSMRPSYNTKKLKRNYSQDFITVRNKILKDEDKIKQYESILFNNKLNKVNIKIQDKSYKDLLSSCDAISQNRLVYNNIMKNYKGTMISQYAKTINKLNPIIRIHEKNINQNIKIFPSITKAIEINDKNDYYYNDDEDALDSQNDNLENMKKKLNENLFKKPIANKRLRLYALKNSYQYPAKNFPGSLSEFSITQDKLDCIIYGGHNSGKYSNIWRFNSLELSWEVIKPQGNNVFSRYAHTAVLNSGNLYIYGGVYNNIKSFADLVIFNLETKQWTSPLINTKYISGSRKNHVACSVGNCMFVHGGTDEDGEYLNDCFLLNYQPLQWKIPLIQKTKVKTPCLAYHSCCLILPAELREESSFTITQKIPEERLKGINIKELGIYIFGGKISKAGNLNKNLYVLKIGGKNLEWIILNTIGMPPKRRYGASMSYYETGNLLIIHGGRHNAKMNFALNDTFILDLYSLNWMQVDYLKPYIKAYDILIKVNQWLKDFFISHLLIIIAFMFLEG